MQEKDGHDLSFGGLRDWLLLLVAMPIFLGAIYGGAMLGIGSKSGGLLLSPRGGVVVAVIALGIGLLAGTSERARRWLSGW